MSISQGTPLISQYFPIRPSWDTSFHEQVKTDYLCGGNSSKNSISFKYNLVEMKQRQKNSWMTKVNSVADLATTAEKWEREHIRTLQEMEFETE